MYRSFREWLTRNSVVLKLLMDMLLMSTFIFMGIMLQPQVIHQCDTAFTLINTSNYTIVPFNVTIMP